MTTATTSITEPAQSRVRVGHCNAQDLTEMVELFDLYRQFYQQPSDPERAQNFLKERFKRRDSLILIAKEEGRAVGFTQIYPTFSSVQTDSVWTLNDIFVRHEARGRGVANQLLEVAMQEAHTAGIRTIRLSTQHQNADAQRLYLSCGYEPDMTFTHFSLNVQKAHSAIADATHTQEWSGRQPVSKNGGA